MPPATPVLTAFVLDGKGGGRATGDAGARRWTPDQGVLWAVLDRSHPQTETFLHKTMGLPLLTCEALLAEDTRPRCLHSAAGLMMILRGVNVNHGSAPDDMVTLRLWIDAEKVLCLRGRPVLALDDLAARFGTGNGAKFPGGVLVLLVDALTGRLHDVVSNLEDLVDEIEDMVPQTPGPQLRHRLATPRRQVATMRRYLSPQRDMTTRLITEETPLLDASDRLRLREVADDLTRLVEDLDLLRERSMMIHEQIVALAAEQMNKTMYILSLVAAIFLPLTLLTGLLGINVGGLPGAHSPRAFWIVCGLLVVLAGFQWWAFKRRRLL